MNIKKILKEELYRQYNIDNVIKKSLYENINRLILNESLSSVVYRFVSIPELYKSLSTDTLYLKPSFNVGADDMDKNNKFFLSFTRQKNGGIGYSMSKDVRMTFDGNLLNQKYKGGPVDYWGEEMGKLSYYKKKKEGKEIDYNQKNTENEDRLFTDEPTIYNFGKYIKRIDIFVSNDNDMAIAKKCMRTRLANLIYIYTNREQFNLQTKNYIDKNIIYNASDAFDIGNPKLNVEIDSIAEVVSFMAIYNEIPQNNLPKYTSNILTKYNLEKYIRGVLKNVNINRMYGLSEFDLETIFKDLRDRSNNLDAYVGVSNMFRDFLKENGLRNTFEAKNMYKKKHMDIYNKIDYNKSVKIFVVNKFGNDKYMIPYPEKTSFWEVFEDIRFDFVDFIERRYRSHKSKSDESFKKYLQHLQKNEVPLLKMIDIINKLDLNDEDKQELIDDSTYGYEEINYQKAMYGYYNFLNDSQKQEVINMFMR